MSYSCTPLVFELDEAAVMLGKSKRWLEDRLRGGQFPGRKIGRTWKLAQDDLEEIVRLCAVAPTAATPTNSTDTAASSRSSMTRTTARRMRRDDQ